MAVPSRYLKRSSRHLLELYANLVVALLYVYLGEEFRVRLLRRKRHIYKTFCLWLLNCLDICLQRFQWKICKVLGYHVRYPGFLLFNFPLPDVPLMVHVSDVLLQFLC